MEKQAKQTGKWLSSGVSWVLRRALYWNCGVKRSGLEVSVGSVGRRDCSCRQVKKPSLNPLQ